MMRLYTVVKEVKQLADEDTGRTSRLPALNEQLRVFMFAVVKWSVSGLSWGGGGEMESFKTGTLEGTTDGNIQAALGREMEGLGKDLEQKARSKQGRGR
jgi:hypothetical protein